MTHHLSALVARLSPSCRKATAQAANFCAIHGHESVTPAHIWLCLLEQRDADLMALHRAHGIDVEASLDAVHVCVRSLPRTDSGAPSFSLELTELLRDAATSVPSGDHVCSRHLLLAHAQGDAWDRHAVKCLPALTALSPAMVRQSLDSRCANDARVVRAPATGTDSALARFTIDLTARARRGELDPVVGRERETLQLMDVLGRRRQNNPMLVGDAGVGKTAVVEGLALALARGAVPGPLASSRLLILDLALIQAGASVKGEFESRLRDLLAEVKASDVPIILFVDEAHTMVGAGGTPGQNDAANLLKPALARGELRTIGATTWAEYKKYFEKDAALSRRFQPVEVKEPEPAVAECMLRGMVPALEAHTGLRILDEAVQAAVHLSARYVRDRQLPDKAVTLLDTAAARVAMTRMSPHPDITLIEGDLARLCDRRDALERDGTELNRAVGDHSLTSEIARLEAELERRRGDIDTAMAALAMPAADRSVESGLVPRYVDARVVAQVVSDWTGIPAGQLSEDELASLGNLRERLARRVAGQDHALACIADRVRAGRAGLSDPRRPQGVFLLVGPSGVGKTETAMALAEALTGDERHLITVNMSEFQESHSVSGLKGAPAGYVGYGEGGALTEAVRRHPHGVLLLDEVEKAHADVRELFYQVFDRGYMTDAEGRDIDFRHLTILLTSNVGSAAVIQACLNRRPADRPAPEALVDTLRPLLYQAFAPAFLGRMTVVPYFPLPDEVLEHVIRQRLDAIATRLNAQHGVALVYGPVLIEWIIGRCNEADAGARDALRLIEGPVLTAVSDALYARPSTGHGKLRLDVNATGVACRWASRKGR